MSLVHIRYTLRKETHEPHSILPDQRCGLCASSWLNTKREFQTLVSRCINISHVKSNRYYINRLSLRSRSITGYCLAMHLFKSHKSRILEEKRSSNNAAVYQSCGVEVIIVQAHLCYLFPDVLTRDSQLNAGLVESSIDDSRQIYILSASESSTPRRSASMNFQRRNIH